MNYKTPGVYVEEISLLPPSIAQVETAIPAFIGYTSKAIDADGNDLSNVPTRIKSLLDYEILFGKQHEQDMKIIIKDETPYTPQKAEIDGTISPYNMYYSMQMFYANGGGPCYIVSVGDYDKDDASKPSLDNINDYDELKAGLNAIKKIDEITLIVFPEAIRLADDFKASLYTDALQQCKDLQDRFSIFDVSEDDPEGAKFRAGIGNQYLNYGAAYYPYLNTILPYHYSESTVKFSQGGDTLLDDLTMDQVSRLADVLALKKLIEDSGAMAVDTFTAANLPGVTLTEKTALSDIMFKALEKMSENMQKAIDLVTADAFTNDDKTNGDIEFEKSKADPIDLDDKLNFLDAAKELYLTGILDIVAQVNTDTEIPDTKNVQIAEIYTNSYAAELKALLSQITVKMPPSPIIAGIYAKIDRTRGVWKSPANVSINNVSGPAVKIDNQDNANFNVHSTGKSINVIRSFAGRGTMVWGARTLDGNSNEWRYISVRRFFIMVEESVQEAAEQFVFEPNDANTWVKVKAMIENFLILQWRAGALMGSKSNEAFFVKVGLGETMSQEDIFEGRMIVEIGLAAVRPAEFIILRFSHKMLES